VAIKISADFAGVFIILQTWKIINNGHNYRNHARSSTVLQIRSNTIQVDVVYIT